MAHKLKALGLALVAVFALSAVAASAASATDTQGELTSDGLVTLDITELAGKVNALTAFGGSTTCAGSILTGHKTVKTTETEEIASTGKVFKHELIKTPVTAVTVTEDYEQKTCKVVEGGTTHKATVTVNGCDYDFTVGETVLDKSGKPEANRYNVKVDIVCPTNKDIQLDVYAFAGSELGGVACTVTVKEQENLTGPVLTTDTVNDDLNIEGVFTNITVSKSGFGCASEETNLGEFDINVTAKGTNEAGGATGITVTDVGP